MRIKTFLLAGVASLGCLVAAPALAQNTGSPTTNTASPGALAVSDFLNSNSSDSSVHVRTSTRNSIDDSFNTRNSTRNSTDDSFNTRNANNNVRISANQELRAVNSNRDMDHLVDLNGGQLLGLGAPVSYASGANNVSGNAYAAFAGIDSSAWNTGLNSNAQAASNIGAQGSITFSN